MPGSRIAPVGFYIDGFRSLVNVYLPLKNLVVMVGPNDSGKTSFIEAFNLFQEIVVEEKNKNRLKSGYFTRVYKPNNKHNTDFYPQIKLFMFFNKNDLEEIVKINEQESIMKYFYKKNNKIINNELIGIGTIIESKVSYSDLVNQDFSDTIGVGIKRYIIAAKVDPNNNIEIIQEEQISKKSEKYQKIIGIVPNIISFSAQRDLTEEYKSSSGILNKILAEIIGEIIDKYNDVSESITSIKNKIEDELHNRIISEVNRVLSTKYRLNLNLKPILSKPMLHKAFELDIHVEDKYIKSPIPISCKGLGIQNIVYIELLKHIKSCDSKKGVIILIDEPENHLHPKLLHNLYNTMLELANIGNIVILITHSPLVINNSDYRNIIYVERKKGITKLKPLSDIDSLQKINTELGIQLSDVLGANAIILVEGWEDEIFIKRMLKEQKVFVPYIVKGVRGSGEIHKYVEVYLSLALKYTKSKIIVIADNDRFNEVRNKVQNLEIDGKRLSKISNINEILEILRVCDIKNGTLEDLYTSDYIIQFLESTKFKELIQNYLLKCLDNPELKKKIDEIIERTLDIIHQKKEEYTSNPRKENLKKIRCAIDNATGEILREKFSEKIKMCYNINFGKLLSSIKAQLATNATYNSITHEGKQLIDKIKSILLSGYPKYD